MNSQKPFCRSSVRIENVQAPIIPVVAEMIRQHPGTISLGQGVVHYGPPAGVQRAVTRFFDDPQNNKYKPVGGIPELLGPIEAKLRTENGIQTGPESVALVTAGGNLAFANAVLAVAEEGDEIILQTPYYFNHEMAVTMFGCKVVCVATDADYQLRPKAIRDAITPRTRAVVTVSPNNPTGAVYPEAALREVNEICKTAGVYHIHDEAYEYFIYGGHQHFSPGSIPGSAAHTISLYSMSKAYGFASWRIGFMVVPAHLISAIHKIQDTLLICPPVVCQHAGAGAMEEGSSYCHEKIRAIAEVRELVKHELENVGDRLAVPPADGAFYFVPRVNTSLKPMQLVERLIKEFGVAVIPGTAFGIEDDCRVRVAYGALSRETVAEGIGRLVRGIRAIV